MYQDEVVVAFMDLTPVTPGHLLVVPRVHAIGLEDLDEATSSHAWTIARRMARALRRSGLPCEGINVFLADGKAAFQEVFHFHLHVFPGTPVMATRSPPPGQSAHATGSMQRPRPSRKPWPRAPPSDERTPLPRSAATLARSCRMPHAGTSDGDLSNTIYRRILTDQQRTDMAPA